MFALLGRWCDGTRCQARKALGASCALIAGDAECQSGRCSVGVCVECIYNEFVKSATKSWIGLWKADAPLFSLPRMCPANKYCGFTKRCLDRKGFQSPCSSDRECAANSCLNGKCVLCNADTKCSSGFYCVLNGPMPGVACASRGNNGTTCNRDTMCKTLICKNGKCSGCRTHAGCSSSQYCGATACEPRKPLGAPCPRIDGDRQCASGFCDIVTQTCKTRR